MLDHIVLPVSNVDEAKAFYRAALAPLSVSWLKDFSDQAGAGFGDQQKPFFWIFERKNAGNYPLHIAFSAKSRAAVDAFYQAAMGAGGRDNGEPGLRLHYHPNYYGAFVLDLDGNNIEAVCHLAE